MPEILVYKAEVAAGLADKIAKSNTLAYEMPLEVWKPSESVAAAIAKTIQSSQAGEHDSDLFYVKSVLVTTNWNKNDDVFDRDETWMAKSTPTHKPTNIEHDEKKLVGHITSCWAVDLDGEIIPENTTIDDLPDVYNLVTGAVIYKSWKDSDLSARAGQLIQEIEAGKKFVSMECMFTGFNYAVRKADGSCHAVARDENSAWMTKHLRAYGGTGEYEGCKIGRLLRNITFTGKGYVDRPANPDSIIFNDASVFNFKGASKENPFISNGGVYLNSPKDNIIKESSMASEIDTLKTQLDDAKTELKTVLESKATLEAQLAKIDDEKSQAQITDLQAKVTNMTTELDTTKQSMVDATEKIAAGEKTIGELTAKNTELTAKLETMVKAQVTASRISKLIEGGIEREIAKKKVALYATLTDEQFNDIATDLVEAAKKKVPPEDTSKTSKDGKGMPGKDCKADDTVNADTTILDNAQVTSEIVVNATAADTDDTAGMRQELQQAVASFLGIQPETNNE